MENCMFMSDNAMKFSLLKIVDANQSENMLLNYSGTGSTGSNLKYKFHLTFINSN
jgi:hypothetical protein